MSDDTKAVEFPAGNTRAKPKSYFFIKREIVQESRFTGRIQKTSQNSNFPAPTAFGSLKIPITPGFGCGVGCSSSSQTLSDYKFGEKAQTLTFYISNCVSMQSRIVTYDNQTLACFNSLLDLAARPSREILFLQQM